MIPLTILFGIYIICSLAVIAWITHHASEDRRQLEDRLMALTNLDALTAHKVYERPDFDVTEVAYVDERREAELDGKATVTYVDDGDDD